MQPAALIDRWATARSLPVGRAASGGRVTFTVDGRYRIHVSEARNRKVAIESRICDLPADPLQRERLVERVMQISVGRMRADGSMLAVDPPEAALLLQSEAPADADERGLGEAIGRFVNSLSFWRGVVG